jgi:hypothetical protein
MAADMNGQTSVPCPVATPGTPQPWVSRGDRNELRHRAWQWVNSEALRAVLDAFGAEAEDPANLPKLREWSTQHLDSRAGGERHEARPAQYTSEQIRTLYQAAGPLGLLRTAAPSEAAYDLTIVLGGTVTGNETRVAFTFNLRNSGIDFGKLVGAAGYRQLPPAEKRLALDAGAGPSAQRDEYEHLAWVLRRVSSAENRRVLRSEGEPASNA